MWTARVREERSGHPVARGRHLSSSCAVACAVAAFGGALGSACGRASEVLPRGDSWREEQTVAIQEAVFRYQFAQYRSGLQESAGAYCLALLALGDESLAAHMDPPAALLDRFRGHQPPVRPFSQCRVAVGPGFGDVDTVTGRPALVFRLGPLRWESDTEVVVDGGYHASVVAASGHTFRARFTNDKWVVVDDRLRWIA